MLEKIAYPNFKAIHGQISFLTLKSPPKKTTATGKTRNFSHLPSHFLRFHSWTNSQKLWTYMMTQTAGRLTASFTSDRPWSPLCILGQDNNTIALWWLQLWHSKHKQNWIAVIPCKCTVSFLRKNTKTVMVKLDASSSLSSAITLSSRNCKLFDVKQVKNKRTKEQKYWQGS